MEKLTKAETYMLLASGGTVLLNEVMRRYAEEQRAKAKDPTKVFWVQPVFKDAPEFHYDDLAVFGVGGALAVYGEYFGGGSAITKAGLVVMFTLIVQEIVEAWKT